MEIKHISFSTNRYRFLFTVLQMQQILEQTSTWEIRQCLEDSPTTLEDLYQRSIDRLLLQSPSRSLLARKTLIWLAYGKRNLTIKELQHALATAPGLSQLDADRISPQSIIEGACFTLVSIDPRSSVVLLSHFSLQNFLQHHRSKLFQGPVQSDMLACACINYLDLEIFKSGPSQSASELEERVSAYPFAKYAAVHWGDHVKELKSQDMSAKIDDLLKPTWRALAIIQIWFAEMQLLLFDPNVLQTFSALHWTSFFGLEERTLDLLSQHSPDLGSQDPFGRIPLHWAVERNHADIVDILLRHGASLSILDRDNANAIHLAARGGSISILESLLERCQVQDLIQKDNRDQTPLQLAATYSPKRVVNRLVQQMQSFNLGEELFQSGLDFAVLNGRTEIVKALLESGAAKPLELRLAARYGFEDIVKVLFNYGVDVGAKDAHGVAAIHEASASGKIEIIHFLLDNGADISTEDEDGQSPIFYAVKNSNRVTVELLLRQGANVNSKNKAGNTLLGTAIEAGNLEMVQLLLGSGVDPDSTVPTTYKIPGPISFSKPTDRTSGRTGTDPSHRLSPLSLAAYHGNVEIAKALLNSGATLLGQKKIEALAIHVAAYRNHFRILQLLVEAGQDVNIRDRNGLTALHYATAAGNTESIELLIKLGAKLETDNVDQNTPTSPTSKWKYKAASELLFEHIRPAASTPATPVETKMQPEYNVSRYELKTSLDATDPSMGITSTIYVGIHYEANHLRTYISLPICTSCKH